MSNSRKIPAGSRVQVKCRVKTQGNGPEQTVYFSPVITENDEDLTFSETISKLKRGRTNYVYVDCMNVSKIDKVLSKGTVIGSMHSVSAVIPMVNFAGGSKDEKDDSAGVNDGVNDSAGVNDGVNESEGVNQGDGIDVVVGCVSEGNLDNNTEVGENWDLSHLDEKQQAMLGKVLREE